MRTPKRLLMIGNGGAAAHAVQSARRAGYAGEIHLACVESEPAFNPMLAPYYLAGRIGFERCFPFGMGFYEAHRVVCHFGAKVETLDPANRTCTLAGGRRVAYDRCLAASGAVPVLPGVPGFDDSSRVFTLRTASQTKALAAALKEAREIIVLGASLVGTKLASVLAERGLRVTLVDVADHVLPASAHPLAAAVIEGALEAGGVRLGLKRRLRFAEDSTRGIALQFEDGGMLAGDLCVACTGVRACMDYLEGPEVIRGVGIHVDTRMGTSVSGLFAAGDVSQGRNLLSGKREVMGLWGNACYQGRTAGINMAGGKSHYLGSFPQYVSPFSGLSFVSLGDVRRQGPRVHERVRADASKKLQRLLLFDGKRLVGANLINCHQEAGYIKGVIQGKLPWNRPSGGWNREPYWTRDHSFPAPGPCRGTEGSTGVEG